MTQLSIKRFFAPKAETPTDPVVASPKDCELLSIKKLRHDFKQLKSPSKIARNDDDFGCSGAGAVPHVPRCDKPSTPPAPSVVQGKPPDRDSKHKGRLLAAHLPSYKVESVDFRMGYVQLEVDSVNHPSSPRKKCHLRDFWVQTSVSAGDEVMVLGKFDQSGLIVIDDQNNYLIQNPDVLISPTTIGASYYCRRKAVLQEIVRGVETTVEMFLGTLVHDLMQRIVVSISEVRRSGGTRESAKSILFKLLQDPRYRQDMYAIGKSYDSMREMAEAFVPQIEKWAETELSKPGVQVADIEEWIWSPRYGVKGRVDMTFRVNKKILPVEIKTGKPSMAISHTGQVLLYTLLLSEKYRMDISEGLLFYAKNGDAKEVRAKKAELAALVRARNDLSHHLKKYHHSLDGTSLPNLPEPVDDARKCSSCAYAVVCGAYYRTVEQPQMLRKPLPDGHFIHELSKVPNLSDRSLEYFQKWMPLLYTEMQSGLEKVSVLDLWTQEDDAEGEASSSRRASFVSGLRFENVKNTSNQQLLYCLSAPVPKSVSLNPGDLVILREDSNEGLVIDLCTVSTIVRDPRFEVELQADRFFLSPVLKNRRLRIDKYVFSASSMANVLDGLACVLENTVAAQRLRDLFLDKIPPNMLSRFSKQEILECKPFLKGLPPEQQSAVMRACFGCLDYFVIDTKALSNCAVFLNSMIRILRRRKQTVLLVCSNKDCLDSILLPLANDSEIQLLRLGPLARVHPDLQKFCPEFLAGQSQSFDEMKKSFLSANVIGTLAGSHRQPVLKNREFDYCLVYEASVILQPALFGYLAMAKKLVLVGDSNKTPAVKCAAAKEKGLQESLLTAVEDVGKINKAWITL